MPIKQPLTGTPRAHCHKLIRATAIEMAGAVYEEVMKDNGRYAYWKSICPELTPALAEGMFIEYLWPHLIGQARATLATMLNPSSGANLTDRDRADIHEALVKDASLQRGRTRQGTLATPPRFVNGQVVH